MPIFDIILVVILSFFIFYGFFFGFIRIIGSLIGIVVGAFVASRYYLQVFDWLDWAFGGYDNLGKVGCFLIILFAIIRIANVIFFIIDKIYNLVAIIPFSRLTKHLLGALFGFIEGVFIMGLFVYVSAKYAYVGNFFGNGLSSSTVAPILLKINKVLLPLLPEVLKTLKSLI